MHTIDRRRWMFAVLLAGILTGCSKAPDQTANPTPAAAVDSAVAATNDPADAVTKRLCPAQAPCGDSCSNQPYVDNDCWTTAHGVAAANIVVSPSGDPQKSSNMLMCDSGPYALCFYSGPPMATGINADNQALPCVVDESGDTASCSCQYYGSGISYVDINGIINQNAWYETVQQCGHDGAGCANMAACGSGPGASPSACGLPEAKVCAYVRDQNADQAAQSLVPGYDVISTFSLAMAKDYDMSAVTPCDGDYLGCMTAPCRFAAGTDAPADGSIVQCDCPIARGPFQIGQTTPPGQSDLEISCAIPPGSYGAQYLWSAARTVKHGNPELNY